MSINEIKFNYLKELKTCSQKEIFFCFEQFLLLLILFKKWFAAQVSICLKGLIHPHIMQMTRFLCKTNLQQMIFKTSRSKHGKCLQIRLLLSKRFENKVAKGEIAPSSANSLFNDTICFMLQMCHNAPTCGKGLNHLSKKEFGQALT